MTQPPQAEKIRALMRATGLSDEGVRLLLRNNATPRNPVVRAAWLKAMAKLAVTP